VKGCGTEGTSNKQTAIDKSGTIENSAEGKLKMEGYLILSLLFLRGWVDGISFGNEEGWFGDL
jgi:hypothetical protein